MSDCIRHSGEIINIEQGRVIVRIVSKSACSGCHVKSSCSASDMKEKLVTVSTADDFNIGDKVHVVILRSKGYLAVVMAYLLPVVIMFSFIIVAVKLGYGEGVAGLGSLVIITIYFLILWLLKGRIENKIDIKIEKI